MIRDLKIGVVIPARNEEQSLTVVLEALQKIGIDDVLVIDGNSADRTVEVAKDFGVNVILQEGRGKGNAVSQVFCNGYLDVDAVVLLDADGSMRPEEIPLLVEKLASGADLAKGSRFIEGGYSDDLCLLRRFGNFLFLSLVNLFWKADYTDLCYGYAAFRKETVKKLAGILKSQNFEIETEVFIKAQKLGLKVAEVPSVELKRRHGKSNLKSFTDGFQILRTIIQEMYTRNNGTTRGRC
jgi:glycosyltransferase involved in cell wall biosynthesis